MEMSELRRTREAGFSMIEALIAAAILLIIALGLLPLFARAITDNSNGNDATQTTNGSRTQLEELFQVPFNNTRLVVDGVGTESESLDSWAQGLADHTGDEDEGWWPGTPTDRGTVLWTRTTRVRQYSVSDLLDGDLDNPLPGNTTPTFVQMKEIEVVMNNPKGWGSGQGMTLRIVKPF